MGVLGLTRVCAPDKASDGIARPGRVARNEGEGAVCKSWKCAGSEARLARFRAVIVLCWCVCVCACADEDGELEISDDSEDEPRRCMLGLECVSSGIVDRLLVADGLRA